MDFGSQMRANLWPLADNFEDILEYRFSKENKITFDLLFRIYSAICLDLSINALSENIANFVNGYRFWNDELSTEKGELITENSSDADILNALLKILKDNKRKADTLVLKYIEKIEKNENPSVGEFADELRRIFSETRKPLWKQILIDNAYLQEDGKTLMTSIDEVAAYLSLKKFPVTKEILKNLVQRNGEPIKYTTAAQVASRCKS